MSAPYLEVEGAIVAPEALAVQSARELATRLQDDAIDFASLVECRHHPNGVEWVVFEVEVEVPQLRRHPILSRERLATGFSPADVCTPEVLALRADFPPVPHVNLRENELPRSLCLYEENSHEVWSRWTPSRFIQRIRDWLSLNAQGRLHRPDQPLEPFLGLYAAHLILPASHEEPTTEPLPVNLEVRSVFSNGKFVVAPVKESEQSLSPEFVVSVHYMSPQTHGVVRHSPVTLEDLCTLLSHSEFDLLAELRAVLRDWHARNVLPEDAKAIVVIQVPMVRESGGDVESLETWGFLLTHPDASLIRDGLSIRELGVRLGVWDCQTGSIGLLIQGDAKRVGQDVRVHVMNVTHELTQDKAAIQCGDSNARTINIAAVGVGALGSQVAMNLIRSGFGNWLFVDHDVLMPHNLSRHALDGRFIGFGKAQSMAVSAGTLFPGHGDPTHLAEDVLKRDTFREPLAKAWKGAELILDMSASIAVARTLVHDLPSDARRMSLFLSPSGRDLVILSEDSSRNIPLDSLEMQYYRAILEAEPLRGHLEHPENSVRYGRTCRDVSSRLPQHLVALHAAIAAGAVGRIADRPSGSIEVWGAAEDGSVRHLELEAQPVIRQPSHDWTLVTDGGLADKLACLREVKLPSETGGVLLGSFDLRRRIVYIADALPAPPDSKEWPTLFIRGSKDLKDKVDGAARATRGMIEYVGEWHSHPRGASTKASQDDLKVFAWLTALMDRDSLPAVMIIVGDNAEVNCFVGSAGGTTVAREGP